MKNIEDLKKLAQDKNFFGSSDKADERQKAFQDLVNRLDECEKALHREKQKNEIIQQQNMELTQQMESIRSDFGGDMR